NPIEDLVCFLVRKRGWVIRTPTDETKHPGDALHEMPCFVVHFHLNQHIAREELALRCVLPSLANFDDFLGGNQDLAKLILHAGSRYMFLQRLLDTLFILRKCVYHIPLLTHPLTLTGPGATGQGNLLWYH